VATDYVTRFFSYITNRPSYVFFSRGVSASFLALSGVSQGSVLESLLFDIYINDLYNKIKSMLSGSLVTTAWRVLRLRMEEMASRYGG
jgi:hypothetical protein